MFGRLLLLVALLLLAGCVAPTASDPTRPGPSLALLERDSGGRLGVMLINSDGDVLLSHRADERFAMCSTFKLLLAAMVLDKYDKGGPSLRTPMPVKRSALVPYAPYVEEILGEADTGEVRVGLAAEAAVTLSDNMAANLLLDLYGGPAALTAWLRDHGDLVTRLDRIEPKLNENLHGDLRDTTSPSAMAQSARDVLFSGTLAPQLRDTLNQWMIGSKTGGARIRSGLPRGWIVGDKTGTCGNAYNDVAVFTGPADRKYVLAVYLDRPSIDGDNANALIANVARLAAETITKP